MSNYNVLSLLQAIFIIICAWSLLDYGYSLQHVLDGRDLVINKILFDSQSDFWNPITFWAYLALIVGILQAIKALTVDK